MEILRIINLGYHLHWSLYYDFLSNVFLRLVYQYFSVKLISQCGFNYDKVGACLSENTLQFNRLEFRY